MKGKCADLICRLYLVRNHDRSHACAVSRTDTVKRILDSNGLCGVCVKNFAGLQKNIRSWFAVFYHISADQCLKIGKKSGSADLITHQTLGRGGGKTDFNVLFLKIA